jgi:hypothetical protein
MADDETVTPLLLLLNDVVYPILQVNDAVCPMSYPPGSVLHLGSKENPDGSKTTAFLIKRGGWSDEERQEAIRQFKEGKLFSRIQTVRPRHTEQMRDDHDGPIRPDLHHPSGWNDG